MQQFLSNFYFWTTYDSFAEKHSINDQDRSIRFEIQKAKKYPWGETWDSKRSTESRISPLLSYFLSQP